MSSQRKIVSLPAQHIRNREEALTLIIAGLLDGCGIKKKIPPESLDSVTKHLVAIEEIMSVEGVSLSEAGLIAGWVSGHASAIMGDAPKAVQVDMGRSFANWVNMGSQLREMFDESIKATATMQQVERAMAPVGGDRD